MYLELLTSKAIDFKAIDYHMNQIQLGKVKGRETLFLPYTKKKEAKQAVAFVLLADFSY